MIKPEDIIEDIGTRKFAGLISILIVITLYIFGLWPFNFHPRNEVAWLKENPGVSFEWQGIIFSRSFLPITSGPAGSGRLSIEIAFTPGSLSRRGISRILSFTDANNEDIFFIGQWKTDLIIRARYRRRDGSLTYRETGLNTIRAGKDIFLSVVSGPRVTTLFVNGKIARKARGFHLINSNITTSGKILLGNSPSGKKGWKGKINALCLSAKKFSDGEVKTRFLHWQETGELPKDNSIACYDFLEKTGNLVPNRLNNRSYDLVMPDYFTMLKKTILTPTWEDFRFNRSYFSDMFVNLLGFIPFGLFLSIFLINKGNSLRSGFLLTVISGFLISLSIELLQVYLPTRSSQMTDVIMNTFGTALGAMLFQRISGKRHSGRRLFPLPQDSKDHPQH